jgi:hypothetical protein
VYSKNTAARLPRRHFMLQLSSNGLNCKQHARQLCDQLSTHVNLLNFLPENGFLVTFDPAFQIKKKCKTMVQKVHG